MSRVILTPSRRAEWGAALCLGGGQMAKMAEACCPDPSVPTLMVGGVAPLAGSSPCGLDPVGWAAQVHVGW